VERPLEINRGRDAPLDVVMRPDIRGREIRRLTPATLRRCRGGVRNGQKAIDNDGKTYYHVADV